MVSFLSLLALAATAAALKITSPSKDDEWRTGSEQTIKWDAVSSDQDTFNIYLSNMASYPSTTILLASDVSSADGSYTIDGSKLTKGTSYTINFTNGTESSQIYAQSVSFTKTLGLRLFLPEASSRPSQRWDTCRVLKSIPNYRNNSTSPRAPAPPPPAAARRRRPRLHPVRPSLRQKQHLHMPLPSPQVLTALKNLQARR